MLALRILTMAVLAGVGPAGLADEAPPPSQQDVMASKGFVRYRGAWRTSQEIQLIERDERVASEQRQWVATLERLRKQLDKPGQGDRAAEELRAIVDARAVPALAAALGKEPVQTVRTWYLEALGRIRSPDAVRVLVAMALDHPDPETRIVAVEQILPIGPDAAAPVLVAALRSGDNAQVNRAAEALGRLGVSSSVGPLIEALETKHVAVVGSGPPAGSTSATFTPSGGGLSMGGGPKPTVVAARNDRVLEALIALTGENFEWNASLWREWLIARQAPSPDYDPRRG